MAEADAEEKLIDWKMYQAVYWYRRGYINRQAALAQFAYWSGLEPKVAEVLFQANMALTLKELGGFKYRPLLDQKMFTPRTRSPGWDALQKKLRRRKKRVPS